MTPAQIVSLIEWDVAFTPDADGHARPKPVRRGSGVPQGEHLSGLRAFG